MIVNRGAGQQKRRVWGAPFLLGVDWIVPDGEKITRSLVRAEL